jgi:hypothetical protein
LWLLFLFCFVFQIDSKDDAHQQVKFRASGGGNQQVKMGASGGGNQQVKIGASGGGNQQVKMGASGGGNQQVKIGASGGGNQQVKMGASDCIDKGAATYENGKTGGGCLACFPSSKSFADDVIVQKPSKTNKFFARFKGSCCDKLRSKIL